MTGRVTRLALVGFALVAVWGRAPLALADAPLPAPLHSDSAVLTVYVDAEGSDDASGASPDQAVQSLAQAQRLVQAGVGSTHRNVTVLIAPGTYADPCVAAGGTLETCTSGAAVRWSFTMPGHTIELRPLDPSAPCPVFDGTGTRRRAWFWLRGARGQLTNIVITGLRVQNYWNAVTFAGSATDPAGYNGGNIVRNNAFVHIGANPQMVPPEAADQDANLSFSAVGITNSRKNIVADNTFADLVTDYKCPWLHALYVAHHASGNWIDGNTFVRACGNPVRIRDRSDANVVVRNLFVDAGYNGYYEEWFRVDDECHSSGNLFTANFLVSGYGGTRVPAAVVSPREPLRCNGVRRSHRVRHGRNRGRGGLLE